MRRLDDAVSGELAAAVDSEDAHERSVAQEWSAATNAAQLGGAAFGQECGVGRARGHGTSADKVARVGVLVEDFPQGCEEQLKHHFKAAPSPCHTLPPR